VWKLKKFKDVYFFAFLAYKNSWKLILALIVFEVVLTTVPALISSDLNATISLAITLVGYLILNYSTLGAILKRIRPATLLDVYRTYSVGRFVRNAALIMLIGFLPFTLFVLGTTFFFEELFKLKAGDPTATPHEPLIMAILSGLFSLFYLVITAPFMAKALTNVHTFFGRQLYENYWNWRPALQYFLCGPVLFFVFYVTCMATIFTMTGGMNIFETTAGIYNLMIRVTGKIFFVSIFSFFVSLISSAIALHFIDTIDDDTVT
jgi:hypothetical protein